MTQFFKDNCPIFFCFCRSGEILRFSSEMDCWSGFTVPKVSTFIEFYLVEFYSFQIKILLATNYKFRCLQFKNTWHQREFKWVTVSKSSGNTEVATRGGFIINGVFENFAKFTRKHACQRLFFWILQNF